MSTAGTFRAGMTTGVAIVTGAGSGVGRSIAHALLGAGWQVALAGRNPESLRETANTAPATPVTSASPATNPTPATNSTPATDTGPGASTTPGTSAGADEGTHSDAALVVPADVRAPESVAALFDAVGDRWGRIDLLVNNAGVFGPSGAVDSLPLADWQQIIDTNLTGAFLCAQHAVRMMKAQSPRGGRIINNGSISAHTPRPSSVGYTATKHAITGLTKSISLDGRRFDIACGQIDIGNAATDMTEPMSRGARQADGSLVAEPRFDARHVGEAVLYMASLPLDANVQFLTVMATQMPFIGRG